MKLTLIVACSVTVTLLSGCGIIEKNSTNEDSLKDKASLAIGTKPSNISITNVQSGLDRITFDAQANGSEYSCYYTTVIVVKSDAICKKMDAQNNNDPASKGDPGLCNALLKEAGRCE